MPPEDIRAGGGMSYYTRRSQMLSEGCLYGRVAACSPTACSAPSRGAVPVGRRGGARSPPPLVPPGWKPAHFYISQPGSNPERIVSKIFFWRYVSAGQSVLVLGNFLWWTHHHTSGAGLPSPGQIATNRDQTGTIGLDSVPNCPSLIMVDMSDCSHFVRPICTNMSIHTNHHIL
jgi:hypothetical protein